MSVQYIINEKEKQTAVVVPIEEWKELKAEHEKLLNKIEVLAGLQEVQETKQGKRKKGRTLGELLNEKANRELALPVTSNTNINKIRIR